MLYGKKTTHTYIQKKKKQESAGNFTYFYKLFYKSAEQKRVRERE